MRRDDQEIKWIDGGKFTGGLRMDGRHRLSLLGIRGAGPITYRTRTSLRELAVCRMGEGNLQLGAIVVVQESRSGRSFCQPA